MNFDFTEDQVAIRNAITGVCTDFNDDYWLRKDREGGFPEDFYAAIARAGWLGIAMPTEYGGSGLGIAEACVMMEAVSGSGAGLSGASASPGTRPEKTRRSAPAWVRLTGCRKTSGHTQ